MNNALASKLAFCETYDRCGWSMTPTHGKAAYRTEWPKERLGCESMAEILAASPRDNIGVLLGEPSGWLIDIDLDHPLAVEMASDYLPSTGAIFGRAGNLRSHHLYIVTAPIATTQHRLFGTNEMIVELRSTGGQTVFPPSQHPSGEAIGWDTDGEPASIDPTELSAAVSRLADAVRVKLGATSAATPKTNGHAPQHRNRAPLDVNRWLTSHAVPILQYGTLADGSSFWLVPCPGIDSHTNVDFPPFCGRVVKRVECKARSENDASATEVYPRVQSGVRPVVEAAGAECWRGGEEPGCWRRLAAEVAGRILVGRGLGVCRFWEANRSGGRESQAAGRGRAAADGA